MKLYQLLWMLLKHALHGRFRDEVCVSVECPGGDATGVVRDFYWETRADAFCMIQALSEDGPWHDPERIERLIEACSIGTAEAKALRDSVPDEVAQRILARSRELADVDEWVQGALRRMKDA